ncbi:hypothetical protein CkaCkLH20_09228 [Colletotrichum karsti]|uniref:Heterokaryon incompatibility domain-containing protein n=1 Tax=Colletotrichum karsti TaxID=1095194 RepID=A0A9P6I7G8_9PEZI|nr:uncharacterized protein CkaCkLH20_09228 [Colletotrichum karsti]KAF9873415.1 hypothetical protein CkaCkLH20_09228 [Colletotrichum karsti]
MSKCTICDTSRPRHHNPRLCNDCQDWDDLQHVSSCLEKQDKFAHLNPVLFCYKHNPDWPPMRKNNYSEMKDLSYQTPEDFSTSTGCMICEKVKDVLAAHTTEETKAKIAVWKPFVHDPCDDHWAVSKETAAQQTMLPTTQKCVLALVIATSPRTQESWEFEPRVIQLDLRYEEWCYNLSSVTTWERKTMSYGQVRRWLDRCVKDHGADCNELQTPKSIVLPGSFRLVDTKEWRVVRMPDPEEYVALSYVWALASDSAEKQKLQLQRDNMEEMEKPGGLDPDMLPEVVSDAIHLCAELGQRYLWIDRLCIVQDDMDTKTEQLDAMGVIYHRAFLTIVALGDGVTRGLPGISRRPRPSNFVNLSWDLLASMRNPMGTVRIPWIEIAVKHSKWNDRAWTFQERFLSRRRLFFDEGQVYANCCKERWSDHADEYQEEAWRKTHYCQDMGLHDGLNIETKDSLDVCTGPLQAYTPRSLTFSEDILNAFAGVASIMKSQLATDFLCGHPEKYFLESLLWIPNDFGGKWRVVPDIPSWSWASWEGGVEWTDEWTIGDDTYLAGSSRAKASIVDFCISDPTSGLRRINQRDLPLARVRHECRWWALAVLKHTDREWWPSKIAKENRSASVSEEAVNHVVGQCREVAVRHGWEPSTEHQFPRTASLSDLTPANRTETAFRLIEEHERVYWWPPLTAESPEERKELEKLDNAASALAAEIPNALVFNTSVARLLVKPFDKAWFVIPPRRHRTGCYITTKDGSIVGITMRMHPWMRQQIFQPEREYSVLVLGVGTATREMRQTTGHGGSQRDCQWYEWVLLVTIAEEDERGAFRRLAIGSVYPDEWMKTQPKWMTVVVGG